MRQINKKQCLDERRNGCSLLVHGHLNLHCLLSYLSTWEDGTVTCQSVLYRVTLIIMIKGRLLSDRLLCIILPLTENYGSIPALHNDVAVKRRLHKFLNWWQYVDLEIINHSILWPNMYILNLIKKFGHMYLKI